MFIAIAVSVGSIMVGMCCAGILATMFTFYPCYWFDINYRSVPTVSSNQALVGGHPNEPILIIRNRNRTVFSYTNNNLNLLHQ